MSKNIATEARFFGGKLIRPGDELPAKYRALTSKQKLKSIEEGKANKSETPSNTADDDAAKNGQ